MQSTTERPLQFFFYFLTNYNNYIEVNFYEAYERNLMVSNIDRENGIIYHTYQDDNSDYIPYKASLVDFLTEKIYSETEKSKKLIEDNYRLLITKNGNYSDYLKLVEKDIIKLYDLSHNFKAFDLKKDIASFVDYFKSNTTITFTKTFLDTLKGQELIENPKNEIILSFQWYEKNSSSLEILYTNLLSAEPPFIECSFEIFKKAFNKEKMLPNEGIKWLCMSVKNKKDISKVTLLKFINMLFDKKLIDIKDITDSDKIIRNIFLNPEGEQLKNIKGSKQESSKNPSRFDEILKIVNSLTSI